MAIVEKYVDCRFRNTICLEQQFEHTSVYYCAICACVIELTALAKLQCHIAWDLNMSSGGNCLHWFAVYESVTLFVAPSALPWATSKSDCAAMPVYSGACATANCGWWTVQVAPNLTATLSCCNLGSCCMPYVRQRGVAEGHDMPDEQVRSAARSRNCDCARPSWS